MMMTMMSDDRMLGAYVFVRRIDSDNQIGLRVVNIRLCIVTRIGERVNVHTYHPLILSIDFESNVIQRFH